MCKIINTTDGKYLGLTIDKDAAEIQLDDFLFVPERRVDVVEGITRLVSTTYIIDCK